MKDKIRLKFDQALASGALKFTESSLSIVEDHQIPFQIRLAPSLSSKPKSIPKSNNFNPFLPPDENFKIQELKTHNLLLNKFAVARDHLLLTTKTFKSQLLPLDKDDFGSMTELLELLDEDHVLFFYNSGSKSGASVPHKHIQTLRCVDDGIPLMQVVKRRVAQDDIIYSIDAFEFLHCAIHSSQRDPEHLANLFTNAMSYLHAKTGTSPCEIDESGVEPSGYMSFNFLYFNDYIVIVPRKEESFMGISVNSVGFAGLLLAKQESEFNTLKEHGPLKILAKLGYPINT